jgi:NAD(P)-dependent dehydrogenase (short-subunit alcohol dehydrogenase family)
VAIHCNRSIEPARALAAAIRAQGGSAAALQADLADATAACALIGTCAAEFGPPDCLVNNASLFENDDLASLTPETWDAHLNVNCRAPVLLARSFAEALPAGVEGNVINLIDQRVLRPSPEFFSYAVSKAALWAATRMMAQALGPRIRVNAIGPGPVLQSVHQSPEDFARECEGTLLRRGVDAADIAAAVRFIIATPSMTGQMIALDSGQHLS